jgi:hypothetical protein
MITLFSTTEGQWAQRVKVELTEAQKTLIASTSDSDKEAKRALMTEIKTQSQKPAETADAAKAQAKYVEVKPTLTETDTYQLIAMDVTIADDTVRGILNCRVNSDHKQIRF